MTDIRFGQPGKIRRHLKPPLAPACRQPCSPKMLEIVFTPLKHHDLAWVNIESQHGKPSRMKCIQQGQADISQADNADQGGMIGDV